MIISGTITPKVMNTMIPPSTSTSNIPNIPLSNIPLDSIPNKTSKAKNKKTMADPVATTKNTKLMKVSNSLSMDMNICSYVRMTLAISR